MKTQPVNRAGGGDGSDGAVAMINKISPSFDYCTTPEQAHKSGTLVGMAPRRWCRHRPTVCWRYSALMHWPFLPEWPYCTPALLAGNTLIQT